MLLSSDTKGDLISLEREKAYKKSGVFGNLNYSVLYFPSINRGVVDVQCTNQDFECRVTLDLEQSGPDVVLDTKPLEREAFRRGYAFRGLDSFQKIVRDAILSASRSGHGLYGDPGLPEYPASAETNESTDLYLREIRDGKIDLSRRFS